MLLHGSQLGLGAFLQKKLPSASKEAEHKGERTAEPFFGYFCSLSLSLSLSLSGPPTYFVFVELQEIRSCIPESGRLAMKRSGSCYRPSRRT